jgi:hypothetical protein
VTDWSAQAADVISHNWALLAVAFAAVVLCGVAYLAFVRSDTQDERDIDANVG